MNRSNVQVTGEIDFLTQIHNEQYLKHHYQEYLEKPGADDWDHRKFREYPHHCPDIPV